MKHLFRPPSNKSAQSYLSMTSHHCYNSIDGLNIIHKNLNVLDYLKEQQTKKQIKRNILFDHPFPLIEILSKRKVLNNSNRLLRDLIKCNQKNLLKTDEQYISKRYESSVSLVNNSAIENRSTTEDKFDSKQREASKTMQMANKQQPIKIGLMENKTSSDTLYSLTSLPKVERRTIAVSNLHRRSHDSNLFNRNRLFKDPSVNFSLNAYKMKKMYINDHFINKIKNDVSHLKFNRELRICYDLIQ